MRFRQRLGLRVGLAILTAAAVLLEIALHRIHTALFGHHLALAALPLALLGAGAGGVALGLAPGLCRPRALLARLGYLGALAAAATLASLLIILHLKPADVLDGAGPTRLAALALASALPFFFTGLAAFAILRHAARDVGRLGFTAFAAAALTGPLAVALLRIGAPRLSLIVIILDGLAVLAFYLAARLGAEPDAAPIPRARGGVVATVVLASGVLLAGDLGAPWIKVTGLRWGSLDKTEVQEWTALGLVTVDKAAGGTASLRLDGTAALPMMEGKIALPLSADDMPYVLHKDASPVLVAGAAGGRDVRIAQKYAQKEIHAVEPSGLVVRALMRDRYRKWNGDVLDKPEVQVAVEDPRGYLRRSPVRFRTIVLPLPDTQMPAALGALAGTPSGAYTVDALREALDRLTPDGVILISRWDTDADRLFALAAAGLRAAGIADPAQHVYACGGARSTAALLTRAALTPRDLGQLRAHCRKNKLNEAFAPDQPHGELRRLLFAAPEPLAAAADTVDLTPSTDDRPFYFAGVPHRLTAAALGDRKALLASHQAVIVLLGLLLVTVGTWLLGAVLPALRRPRDRERGARLAPLVYFSAATAALVLAALALAGRLPLLLGHPGHALTTVHVALLAFAGAGSLLASRGHVVFAEESAGYRAQLLVAALALTAVALGPIIALATSLPLPARLAVAIVLLAPLGVLLGSLLPLGIKLLAARTPELIPWSLGAGLLAGAAAATAGMLLAMLLGYSAVLLAAACAALVAAGSVPAAPRRW
jgi:hypothetical protein